MKIRKFLVTGATTLNAATLQALLQPYEGQEYTLKELNKIAQVVAGAYRRRGYFLARAFVPAQTIRDDTARIQVVEARIGKIIVEGNKYRSKRFIESFFQSLREESAPRFEEFDRAVRLLNEETQMKAVAVLRTSPEPERVDIVVRVEDKNPVVVSADYNNLGNRLVGSNRVGLSVLDGNLTGRGDRLLVRTVEGFPSTDMTPYLQTSYGIPLNADGTMMTASYSNSTTAVGQELAFLDIRSRGSVYALAASQPITRSVDASSTVNLAVVSKSFLNYVLSSPSSQDQVREVSLDYSGDFVDSRGRNIYDVTVTQGLGTAFGGSSGDNPLSSRKGAGDEFTKFNSTFIRLQPVGTGGFLILRGTGQLTTAPLVVGEQYSLGGPDSVRGYSQSEFLGDYGYTLSMELRAPLLRHPDGNLQFAVFLDEGLVRTYAPPTGQKSSQSLTGVGFGFVGAYGSFNGKIDVGFPIAPSNNAIGHVPLIFYQFSTVF